MAALLRELIQPSKSVEGDGSRLSGQLLREAGGRRRPRFRCPLSTPFERSSKGTWRESAHTPPGEYLASSEDPAEIDRSQNLCENHACGRFYERGQATWLGNAGAGVGPLRGPRQRPTTSPSGWRLAALSHLPAGVHLPFCRAPSKGEATVVSTAAPRRAPARRRPVGCPPPPVSSYLHGRPAGGEEPPSALRWGSPVSARRRCLATSSSRFPRCCWGC